ncbi:family 78 glycoside hydrolase catalytic domain [Actinoallomurus rhizosphaericola]|uniref:family 78 glycoside hydrolase catalytic domain n=1 Tax=Actinoallomurus rhizosphaericola TaxID=2952536 RepID=UPI002092E083|nr:family 78 glycoside hydrolase catalytic domain [Actinoallomurus rhizosphaericola]MCO5997271.1 glycoside hydrolase family 78 protein [Actinoallomurus rhizosphaericola]
MRRRFLAALTAAGAATTAVAALLPAPAWAGQNHAPQAPTGLTVGDQTRPLDVEGSPAFGWLPRDVDPGEVQSAYQIRISAGDKTVWDSGKVASSQESYVPGPGDLPHGSGFAWTVRTWDRAGEASPWAKPAEFDTGIADADWQASWIRRTTGEKDDYTYARKEFAVGASPIVRARAYVAASQQYDLHVNGRLVDRGAAFSYPGEGYYKAVDITRLLKPGKTAAVGALYHWYGPGQGRPSGEPGLLMRVVVDHADGSREVVVTDGSWKVARANWKTTKYRNGDGRDYIEDIDGTTEPLGWDKAGFDDSSWTAPQVVGAHPAGVFTHLQGQESALAYETVHPVTVTRLASGAVVADFGKIIPAVPVVRFENGVKGTAVTMTAGYLLAGDGTVSNSKHDNQTTDLTYGYTERDGDQTVRYYTYEGFRYLQINADVPADDISAIVQHTDVPSRTRLETSNSGVNAAYDLMQRSALYDSQEQFLDTPTREKGQFLGDSVDVSLATMSGWGERRLTRKAIREFIASQTRYWPDGRLNAVYPNGDGKRDIPDYTEMFPGWVWEYYLQSGDAGTLSQAYPVMAAVADYVRRYIDPSTGLVTKLAGGSGAYLNGIIDWPNRYGYDTDAVARTTVNELAVDVLNATARAAKALGKDSSSYERDAATLTGAINGKLRRADGVYIDGLESDGSQSTHASQIANAYAVAFGLTSDATVTDQVASLGLQMSPMTVHWLMAALADRPEDFVTRLTDPNGIGYGKILASGGTFTWESWEAPQTGDSLSHGWGASPVIDVQQDLLGVAVTAPGAAAIRVRPPASGLTAASGTVPTQRGDVHVSWHRSGDKITVYVDVPVNVTAEIDLPTTGTVKVKGEADYVGRQNGRTVYETGSGSHTFTAQG